MTGAERFLATRAAGPGQSYRRFDRPKRDASWISPEGEEHKLAPGEGHLTWVQKNGDKLSAHVFTSANREVVADNMMKSGWIRKADSDAYSAALGHEHRVHAHAFSRPQPSGFVHLDVEHDGPLNGVSYKLHRDGRQERVGAIESVADILIGARLYESAPSVEYWTDVHGYHHGQTDATIYATPVGQLRSTENAVGRLPYSIYQGNAHVNHIWTHPDHLRKGIASGMFDHLLKDHKYHEIKWGMTTPDGTQLKKAMDAKHGGYIRTARIQRGLERARRREVGAYDKYLGGA